MGKENLTLQEIAALLQAFQSTGALSATATTALTETITIPLTGVITAVPLMMFAVGARRLPLATVGFLQYIAPSLNFLVAVLLFREPFDTTQLVGFALIWLALAVYSADLLHAGRKAAKAR